MLFGGLCGCNGGCERKPEPRCTLADCMRPEDRVTEREHFVKETRVSTVWKREDCGCGCGCNE